MSHVGARTALQLSEIVVLFTKQVAFVIVRSLFFLRNQGRGKFYD
jgi:hypothetical protein